jgi:DNA-binding IclR family transcriptional regulator
MRERTAGDESNRANGVQYVQKVAAILASFRRQPGELGVSEISRSTGINKSTVSRLLSALGAEELVTCDPISRRYRLGPGIISLAAAAEPQIFLPAYVRPYLERLNAATGETAGFEVLDGFDAVSIEAVSGPRTLRAAVWSGRRAPLHASAAGKCLLAFSPPRLFDDYIASHELVRYTPRTITDISKLRREIARVRERGYSDNDAELEEGVGAVAAPMCDYSGWVIGVINLSWPTSRVEASDRAHFTALLLAATERASVVFREARPRTAERVPAGPVASAGPR